MYFLYPEAGEKIDLENFTLILPSISVGNVGQLAVDLLLQNLAVRPVARLHHPCFLPIAGEDPHTGKLATSCQLFECKDKKLAIIQHRSPLVPSKMVEYRKFLVDFIKEQKIKRTVLLCSSFSQFFTMKDLQGVPLHYLASSALDDGAFSGLGWKKFSLPDAVTETSPVPGGGIAKSLLEDCEQQGLPLAVLVLVCSEGDNRPEALQLAKELDAWLALAQVDATNKWGMPASWTLPYGSGAPRTVY